MSTIDLIPVLLSLLSLLDGAIAPLVGSLIVVAAVVVVVVVIELNNKVVKCKIVMAYKIILKTNLSSVLNLSTGGHLIRSSFIPKHIHHLSVFGVVVQVVVVVVVVVVVDVVVDVVVVVVAVVAAVVDLAFLLNRFLSSQ